MSIQIPPVVLAVLLCGLCALAPARASEPQEHWLQQPCSLLESTGYARVLAPPAGGLKVTPHVGRRSSECLWTDADANRSLRLVLYPAKDAARVAAQLQRLQGADTAPMVFAVGATRVLLSADRTVLSLGVGHWMLSVFGSVPLDESGARALAAELVQRVGLAETAP